MAEMIQSGFMTSFLDAATSWLIVLIALTIASAISTRFLARSKGRSVVWWVALALAIPVVPLIFIWLLPVLPPQGVNRRTF
ncbi:MAG: hypothetical protein NT159_14030 [Proteobacteria bacterium]|nr:hypothetical protein [Pseudomonadota bacterium]